jgi:beta-1,4-mannosyltransferase
MRITVAVLGDLGRSPRMLYHALALADRRADVDLVGYVETPTPASVATHPRIRVVALRAPRRAGGDSRRFLAAATGRALGDAAGLFWALWRRVRPPDVILVQSPPAVPTLACALAAARLHGAPLVVDWHNLGWAMLALRLGREHAVVRLAARYERLLGRRADAHLCVSRALASALAADWGLGAVSVLHDRPVRALGPTPLAERHAVFRRLAVELDGMESAAGDAAAAGGGAPPVERTPFTARAGGSGAVVLRADRPALIVSPTSWTADEYFTLLFAAVERWEALLAARERAGAAPAASAVVLITGEGPGRRAGEARMRSLPQRRVLVRTAWLDLEDYRRLLGAADLGLCLHRSASGLDLPMKIADMLGAGVPVCALAYAPCLAEVVRDGESAQLFTSSDELADGLARLFDGFPQATPHLDRLRQGARQAGTRRWDDEWEAVAPAVLAGARRTRGAPARAPAAGAP